MENKMEGKTNISSDVLHSSDHSKLSAEEIAKAVARHNRHHPGTKTATSEKPQTAAKK
jgi:threonine aldolase